MSNFIVLPSSSSSSPTYPRNILFDSADRTATGYTGDQLLTSYLLPAGTLKVGDLFRVQWGMSSTVLAGKEAKFYFNTVSSLSGAQPLFRFAYASSACASNNLRHGLIKASNICFVTVEPTTSAHTSDINITTGSLPSTVSFDPTIDNYLILGVYLNNASEQYISKYVLMDIYR